jgi:hypothetical protein
MSGAMATRSSGQPESEKGRARRRLMLRVVLVEPSGIPGEGFNSVRMEAIHGIPRSPDERPEEVDSYQLRPSFKADAPASGVGTNRTTF